MKYYLIAGEASGDLHGANLIKALKQEDAQADFRGFGGDLMQKEGVVLDKHCSELAFMGMSATTAVESAVSGLGPTTCHIMSVANITITVSVLHSRTSILPSNYT